MITEIIIEIIINLMAILIEVIIGLSSLIFDVFISFIEFACEAVVCLSGNKIFVIVSLIALIFGGLVAGATYFPVGR